MKNTSLFTLLLLIVVSCAKYPEGGLHKLAKGHIIGTWKMTSYYMNGFDFSDTVLVLNFQETFNEGGTFERRILTPRGSTTAMAADGILEENALYLKYLPIARTNLRL